MSAVGPMPGDHVMIPRDLDVDHLVCETANGDRVWWLDREPALIAARFRPISLENKVWFTILLGRALLSLWIAPELLRIVSRSAGCRRRVAAERLMVS